MELACHLTGPRHDKRLARDGLSIVGSANIGIGGERTMEDGR
jgi:hypothetical protein